MAGRDQILELPRFKLAFLFLAVLGISYLSSFDGINFTLFTVRSTPTPLFHQSIYPPVTSSQASLTRGTGNLNHNNYNLHHRRSNRCPDHLQLLGNPRLNIFSFVFSIISLTLPASEVAEYLIITYSSGDCIYSSAGVCYYKHSRFLENLGKRSAANLYTYRNAMAAASGPGGLGM